MEAKPPDENEKLRRGLLSGDRTEGTVVVELHPEDRPPPRPHFPLIEAPEIFAPLGKMPWLCKTLGIMPGRVTLLSGIGGVGKTMLAQQMGLCLAAGLPSCWGGVPLSTKGRVVHIDYEQTAFITCWRYQRLAWSLGVEMEDVNGRLSLASMPSMHLTHKQAEEAFVILCTDRILCIIDNFRAACPGVDENASEVRQYMDLLTRVSGRTGCTMLVLVHAGKETATPRPGAQSIRGSGAIVDAGQQAIQCSIKDDGIQITAGSKSNLTKSSKPFVVRFVDDGWTDVHTESTVGLKIEYTPPEKDAKNRQAERPEEKRVTATDEEQNKAFDAIRASILECIRTTPGIGGARPIAEQLGLNKGVTQTVFNELRDERLIENRGGLPPQSKWYVK